MAQRTLFFDLDETLVSTGTVPGAPRVTVPSGLRGVPPVDYSVLVRPGAEVALQAAREHFDAVHVFTAASLPYALAVLDATGLRDLVDEVYTVEDVFSGKQDTPNLQQGSWALIDNDEGIAMSKVSAFALGEPIRAAMRRYWIPIPDFAPDRLSDVARFANHDLLASVYEAEQRSL
jgi:phosphoglycolate phosphatase-like HAD superfamily hydrolase